MNLLFFFKMISEFSFYFIPANYLARQFGGRGVPLVLCLTPALAVGLCQILNRKQSRWERAPLLLCLPALFFLHSGGDWGVYLFGCLYGALTVRRRFYFQSHETAADNFERCSSILAFVMPVLCMASGGMEELAQCVPLALLFLSASILQTRMLRHDDATIESPAFLLRNVAALGALALLGGLVSTPAFRAVSSNVFSFLWNLIVVNLAQLLAYGVVAIAWVLGKIYSLFQPDFSPTLPEQGEIQLSFGLSGLEYEEVGRAPFWVQALLIGGIVLIAAAVMGYILYRLAGRRQPPDRNAVFQDRRERLETRQKPPRREIFPPWDPRRAARYYYRKFLQDAARRGAVLTPDCTTQDIFRRSAQFYDPQALEDLRRCYLLARYNDNPPPPDLARQAKAYYNKTIQSAKTKEEASK